MPQRTYSWLGGVVVLWLAFATLYHLVCFAAPQLTFQEAHLTSCLMPAYPSQEEERRYSQVCEDAWRAHALQQERRRGVQGMLVWGSMLVVSTVLLRSGRQRAAA